MNTESEIRPGDLIYIDSNGMVCAEPIKPYTKWELFVRKIGIRFKIGRLQRYHQRPELIGRLVDSSEQVCTVKVFQ